MSPTKYTRDNILFHVFHQRTLTRLQRGDFFSCVEIHVIDTDVKNSSDVLQRAEFCTRYERPTVLGEGCTSVLSVSDSV